MAINEVYRSHEDNLKTRKIVYYILGVLEVLLAFRLIFKLLGANPGSSFVSLIYSVTGVFLIPFKGVFRTAINNGFVIKSILEPTTIIAIIVYAIFAFGIVKLIEIISNTNKKVN